MVGGPDLSASSDASIYLVDGSERAVLIDAGTGTAFDKVRQLIKKTNVSPAKISHLILTHCHVDHSAGIPQFRKWFGLRIIAHQRCADILEKGNDRRTGAAWYGIQLPAMNIDETFQGDDYRISVGDTELVCIYTPGHSPGSISVFLDRDGVRILFGQDIHGPILTELDSNEKLWQASLKRLLSLEADILCEGHYGIFQPRSEVTRFIESFL
ncbi:MBL fold metallo-hydrolase [candidate division CSSED10-310 bacterium]|uniref:MBL fold metallo-hydrolase n=1 Tax=candidate division CSSED10-310 bacterium TaxID=2855610 RepID=A0ABV6Z2V1_UNCC1